MERDTNPWRIKKEISLGDLIAIVVAIAAVLTAYMRLDARVTVVELTAAQNAQSVNVVLQEIRIEMRRLADKLDRFTERKP